MKKLFQLNTVINSSATGRISKDIGDIAIEKGWESFIAYGRKTGISSSKSIKFGNLYDTYFHVAKTRLFDLHGLGSSGPTKSLIKVIQEIQPDIIHLHNLHGYYLNYRLLFEYLTTTTIPIVWTLHDCWSFTGHCTHFDFIGCDKWKKKCSKCPQKSEYPSSVLFDSSKSNFTLKKKHFGNIKNLTLVPVSNWLDNLLGESFLAHHSRVPIQNGVDVGIFKPVHNSHEIKQRYGLENKFIILGVANKWNERKGLKDLVKLSKHIKEDEKVVVVGLDEKQFKEIPKTILGIKRTESIEELSKLYSIANVFVNPTYEDTFPTTNLEALSCGTPVISYNTGGATEAISKGTGFVINQGNVLESLELIKLIKKNGESGYQENCRNHIITNFEKKSQFQKYFDLYKSLL